MFRLKGAMYKVHSMKTLIDALKASSLPMRLVAARHWVDCIVAAAP